MVMPHGGHLTVAGSHFGLDPRTPSASRSSAYKAPIGVTSVGPTHMTTRPLKPSTASTRAN